MSLVGPLVPPIWLKDHWNRRMVPGNSHWSKGKLEETLNFGTGKRSRLLYRSLSLEQQIIFVSVGEKSALKICKVNFPDFGQILHQNNLSSRSLTQNENPSDIFYPSKNPFTKLTTSAVFTFFSPKFGGSHDFPIPPVATRASQQPSGRDLLQRGPHGGHGAVVAGSVAQGH